jgi:hypothetical protein
MIHFELTVVNVLHTMEKDEHSYENTENEQ